MNKKWKLVSFNWIPFENFDKKWWPIAEVLMFFFEYLQSIIEKEFFSPNT